MKPGESAKTFLLQIADSNARDEFERTIMMLISDVEVFTKMPSTVAPRVIISDFANIGHLLSDSHLGSTGIISLTRAHEEKYLDDVVSNKLQILTSVADEQRALDTFNKALKFSFDFAKADFRQRSIGAGEILFKMGDQAEHVYLLKKGKLRVFQPLVGGPEKELGHVLPGDFVGEMAYFNNDPRIASVNAVEDSDLVEIPIHNFEAVLMQKPLWCKKLLQSMSARMKEMSQNRK